MEHCSHEPVPYKMRRGCGVETSRCKKNRAEKKSGHHHYQYRLGIGARIRHVKQTENYAGRNESPTCADRFAQDREDVSAKEQLFSECRRKKIGKADARSSPPAAIRLRNCFQLTSDEKYCRWNCNRKKP